MPTKESFVHGKTCSSKILKDAGDAYKMNVAVTRHYL
jgi:hypothetical protein